MSINLISLKNRKMKFQYFKIVFVFLVVLVINSCAKEKNDYYNYTEGTDSTIDLTSNLGFLDLLKLDSEVITLTAAKVAGENFSGMNILASVSPHNSIVSIGSVSGGSGNLTISISELLSKLNKKADEIKVGENVRFLVDMVQSDGTAIRARKALTLSFSCFSDIAGEYTSLTTGSSTDGCCPNPVVNFPGEVTLTQISDGRYAINDFSAGLYLEWYSVYGISSVNDSPGKILDICNTITFFDTTEPFATPVVGEGARDNVTGVITYSWENGYGDKGTVVLTPK
jgi:hypothetical protein